MALTTRGKLTLTLRLAGLGVLVVAAVLAYRTYQAAASMRMVTSLFNGGPGASKQLMKFSAAFQPDYMPALVLATGGALLVLASRPLIHLLLSGVEERPPVSS